MNWEEAIEHIDRCLCGTPIFPMTITHEGHLLVLFVITCKNCGRKVSSGHSVEEAVGKWNGTISSECWSRAWDSARQRISECIAYLDQNPDCCSEEAYPEVVKRLRWVLDEVLVVHDPRKGPVA